MFTTKTYKSKLILLIGGFILLLIIIYHLAYKKSINAVKLYNNSKTEMELIENAPVKLAKLNVELKKISNIIVSGSSSTEELRQKLFDFTSVYCHNHNTQLIEMPDPSLYNKSGYNIIIHSLILSGSFKNLLNYIYYLEQKSKFIKITSVEFFIDKASNRSKNKKLFLKVYFQNLEKVL